MGVDIAQLHDPHEYADALQVGTHGDVLVRAVHAASRQGLFDHEGAAAQAGVADALILVGAGAPAVNPVLDSAPLA